MEFRLESDYAEAYECASSLSAYARRTQHKTLEAGTAWVKETAASLSPSLHRTLQKLGDPERFDLPLFVSLCPGDRTAETFANWLSALSPGELYDLASSTGDSVPAGLPEIKDRAAEALLMWNEQYFSRIDPAISAGLKQAEKRLKQEISNRPPEEVFESATCGMRLSPGMQPPDRVILVPQYHQRPFNLLSFYPKLAITMFPVDALPQPEGFPPPALLRLARALDDESRLRILRFVADNGQATFTEIVKQIGISKSTIHYHLILLRAAGLLTVYAGSGSKLSTYSLRNADTGELGAQLTAYLHPASSRTASSRGSVDPNAATE
ncbi:hypothetical protein CDO73_15520 [Saccharibacillus sp. O23]|uniref:ArsR/SmtB family transcription factor n=1 Tax=Saccharibacillus sp. O23 TaxID=2009338 RepID=UPI000B4E6B7B|nr:winged helix-turn-helix domain-containing protein [Saccharibacillus sp. O23]OWR29591.1 hypothetical protein CDO73_15520 [Saccharibacillus sp. O23]